MSEPVEFDQTFLNNALKRVTWFTMASGVVICLAGTVARGPLIGAGILVGAIISVLNFTWLKGLVQAIGGTGERPMRGSAVFLIFRYVLAGALVYAIVTFTGVAIGAILVGLLANLPAILLEVLYELVFLKTQ